MTTAHPSAIGLFGLAIVTFLASRQKLGWTEELGLVIPWAIFLGGIAQFYTSILDAKHNNIFSTTAFEAWGLFWTGVALTWFVQAGLFGEVLQASADIHQLGVVYLGYLIFTVFMMIGALETNNVLFSNFFLIKLLFIGLSFSSFGIIEHGMHLFAAYTELAIALLSFYGAGVNILNKQFGFEFLPLSKPFGLITKKTIQKRYSTQAVHK